MESLHLSFSRAVEAGIFTGIKIDSSLTLSHLLYADDAVFIGECHLLGIGVSDVSVSEAANRIGCSVMKAPFWYLGIMVGGNISLVKGWDESIAKLKKKLSKWKLKTLSVGGRLTVLKAVLGSTPIYNMSLFKVPKQVGNGLRTNFWNDPWIGDTLLKHLFPRLGEESHQLSLLTNLLDTVILSNMEDRWFFDLNGDGRFCVKDVRCLLDDVFLPKAEVPTRWIKSIRSKSIFLLGNFVLIGFPLGCDMAKDVMFLVSRWWDLEDRRNRLLFEVKKPRKDVIFDDIVLRSFNWCVARGSLTNSLDTRNHLKIHTTFLSGQPGRPYLCINKLAPSIGPSTKGYSEKERVMENTCNAPLLKEDVMSLSWHNIKA
nr:RNA-directed DNA polymerase, eukaryota [Tanacetum cinerariifolium]